MDSFYFREFITSQKHNNVDEVKDKITLTISKFYPYTIYGIHLFNGVSFKIWIEVIAIFCQRRE